MQEKPLLLVLPVDDFRYRGLSASDKESTPSCCEWECAIVTIFGYGPPPSEAPGALQEFDKSCQTSPSAAEMMWNLLDWAEATQHCPTHRESCGPRAPVHCDSIVSLLLTMGSDLLVRLGHRESRLVNSKTCTIASIHANFRGFLKVRQHVAGMPTDPSAIADGQ